MHFLPVFIFCSLLTFSYLPAVSAETVNISSVEQPDISYFDEDGAEENFPAMQFIFILVIFGLMLFLVGVGVILTILALLAFFGLITLGLVSASMAVGLYRKSLRSGFRTLVILASTVAGGLCGILVAWFVHLIMFSSRLEIAIPAGAVAGVLSGVLFGFLCTWIIRRLSRILNEQFQRIRAKN